VILLEAIVQVFAGAVDHLPATRFADGFAVGGQFVCRDEGALHASSLLGLFKKRMGTSISMEFGMYGKILA